ncbi:hypothetical protein [Salegentibacter maritimus]|uniref:hypothetical protein n=1 Tax=Salegentibacter maritimus TaxID=2794347 RepID=UPI0018E3FCA0|nr:hypothetical protein [Salegentibacter maritimus]MBI6118273.1 hypothetical protein [Salegentibacter maritimus]
MKAKKEDIRKLEENWKSLKQEDKDREQREFRDLKQKEKDSGKTLKKEKDRSSSKNSGKANSREEREFMDGAQKEKTDKRK